MQSVTESGIKERGEHALITDNPPPPKKNGPGLEVGDEKKRGKMCMLFKLK